MKNLIYKKALLILCLLMATVSLKASNEAEYKSINKAYTLNADGSYSQRVIKEIKLLTHKAFNDLYGETFIVYNPKIQSLKINESYTTQADGTVIKTPQNAFNEVLPASAANAPAYNHLKEMVVTHTGLEIGATIYLDYTLTTTPTYNSLLSFDINEEISESSPVKEYTISITAIPGSLALNHQLINSKVKPKVSDNTTKWVFKNVPAAALESYKPQNGTTPHLLATTIKENAVAATYTKRGDIEYSKLAQKLTKDSKSEDEKIAALTQYAVHNTSYSRLPFAYQDNSERRAEVVAKSGYSTKMERVALLGALLKGSDIAYELVFAYPKEVNSTMLTYSTLKDVLLKIGNKYYNVWSTTPIDMSSRSMLDSYYGIKGGVFANLHLESTNNIATTHQDTLTNSTNDNSGYITYTPLNINKEVVKGWRMSNLPTTRKSTLELPSQVSESSKWNIVLKDGVTLQTPLMNIALKEPFGSFSISLTQKDNVVTLERNINFTKQVITTTEYAKFRNFITQWSSKKGSVLLFEKSSTK